MLRNSIGENQVSKQKVIELDGDLDLSATAASTSIARSRTPRGARWRWFRMPKTGPVVLTSDVCY